MGRQTIRHADEITVAVVTAACIIGVAAGFKNLLHIDPPFLYSTAAPVYPFIVHLITRPAVRRFKYETMLWCAVIIAVTTFTLLLYVF